MADILEEIIAYKRYELRGTKQRSAPTGKANYEARGTRCEVRGEMISMRKALLESSTGIIAEFKRRSPSRGWIKKEGRVDIIPLAYQQNGAAALSILTDEHFFGGSDAFITTARTSGVNIPILYKNFVIDERQLFHAVNCGASAVLLIAAALTKKECAQLVRAAHSLHLEVLLEMHSESELEYVETEPDMCGINNRHLGTFVTDVETSFRLAELLPKDVVKVSESGISSPETVRQLREVGYKGFLIGENFMKTDNPGEALKQFIEQLKV